MNVLHLYDGHERVGGGRGSVPNVVWNLARRTADRGHDVTVLERQWAGTPRRESTEGVTFSRLDLATGSDEPWTDVPYEMVGSPVGATRLLVDRTNFALAAYRRLRSLSVDVIHAHLPFAANILATTSRSVRRRLVYTAHLGETAKRVVEPRFSPDAHLARRGARTVALNPEMADAFRERGVPDGRLRVIPNGVDVDRFRSVDPDTRGEVRDRYGLEGRRVVLFVGTVTPRKGVTDLVAAAERVLPGGDPPARLVVAGNDELEPDYVERVRAGVADAGLTDHVHLTGFVPDAELLALYDLADVFVLPSYEEGSSIAVTEAIAAGTPVVSTRIGGVRQQIDDGVHGLLVEPGDVEALGAALATLLADDDRRERMREALATRAEELSWPRVTDRVVDVYREVADA